MNQRKWCGTFRLTVADTGALVLSGASASGNAQQRRKIVRRWKARGYVVTAYTVPA